MSEGEGLPAGWVRATVGGVATSIQYGHTASASKECVPPHFVRITDIQNGQVDWSNVPSCDISSSHLAKYLLKSGDVLFARTGATTGKSYLVKDCPQAVFASYLIRLRMADVAYPPYIHSFFQSIDYWRQIEGGKRGIGQPNVNASVLSAITLPIPPLPEQQRIVAKIEELFSHLDAGISSLERAKANLKRYRASVLKSAVEGNLTEEWRAENPQAEDGQMLLDRILRERREKWEEEQLAKYREKGKEPPKNWASKYKEPAHVQGLFALPPTWAWGSALEICERVESGSTPAATEMSEGAGEIPFIKVYNLTKHGHLDFTVKPTFVSDSIHQGRLKRSRVFPGDVLMNIVGPPLGKVSVVPEDYPEWNINQAVVLFRSSNCISSRYVAICLLSEEVLLWITRTAKATAGQFNISVSNSRLLPIPLPPLAEQHQIVALVEERLSQIDAAEKTIDAELLRAKRLRQSILKQAFEGKLVPQDPNDEPASVLLERIKAARAAEPPKKRAKKAAAK